MSNQTEQSEPLRYERKFLITDYSYGDVEQIIKFHPARFHEIFQTRTVNNIYFDTFGMNNYYANLDGEKKRSKARIRWYDHLFGTIQHPVLEYKVKEGLLGKKVTYRLNPFILDVNFNKDQILSALENDFVPKNVKDDLLSLQPTLLNSYQRKYFLSGDKNFRVTIDQGLTYYRIGYMGNTFSNKIIDRTTIVLELKYDSSLEPEAKSIASLFPFVLTKSSKYVQGLERILI